MNTLPQHINVPLTRNARRWAEEFAAEQDSIEKGKQVYLNTLAVCAVYSYLNWLDIETALNQGDCWYRPLRAIFDVADLALPNIGKLECRPILPYEESIALPMEVMQNRIGYIGVKFKEEFDSVELLGFTPQASPTIPIDQLQSLETLIETIYRHKQLINLRLWFEGLFSPDWQAPTLLLADNFRSTVIENQQKISRAKIINIGSEIVLIIQLTPVAVEALDICLRVYSGKDFNYLPAGLQMMVLDDKENICMEAQARNTDNWMQLEFSCQYKETFSVRLMLGEISITEQFFV